MGTSWALENQRRMKANKTDDGFAKLASKFDAFATDARNREKALADKIDELQKTVMNLQYAAAERDQPNQGPPSPTH